MRFTMLLYCLLAITACNANYNESMEVIFHGSDTGQSVSDTLNVPSDSIKHYLALGDSYTVAESVDPNKSFPAQLVDCLEENAEVGLEIVATTGWTTSDLLKALKEGTKRTNYDLVTLLIGVNNQYQGIAFSVYEEEFIQLLNRSITLANNDKSNVIVVSIPDYAYTPYGQGSNAKVISKEIDEYNAYAKKTAKSIGVQFVNITDITRKGLSDTELVARDGLHPSGKAYGQFVERICPLALPIITN